MNKLDHIDEFRRALKGYHLSKVALQTLSQTKLILLVAPTSSGRNTIIRELLKTGDYHFIVSDTTRQPRMNDGVMEQNGQEYWFRSELEMLQDIKDGKYLEAAVIHNQQVAGVSIRELEAATEEQKIAITDIEVDGADNAHKYKPDTIAIFVLPPSFEEWQRRLKHRGYMEPKEFVRRMTSAADEFEIALNQDFYRFVVNGSVERAAITINQIAKLDEVDISLQKQGRQLAEQLLLETRIFLAKT